MALKKKKNYILHLTDVITFSQEKDFTERI